MGKCIQRASAHLLPCIRELPLLRSLSAFLGRGSSPCYLPKRSSEICKKQTLV
jgi:hypothetical protein